MSVFVQNSKEIKMKIFLFCVITFEPIISKTCEAPHIDNWNLSFVKDKYTYDEKMARKGRTKAIYKVNFISEHTLLLHLFLRSKGSLISKKI